MVFEKTKKFLEPKIVLQYVKKKKLTIYIQQYWGFIIFDEF